MLKMLRPQTWLPPFRRVQARPATARLPRLSVAYLVPAFPCLTETFILSELRALEEAGVPVELYALRRGTTDVMQPEAEARLPKVHFHPYLSWRMAADHAYFLRRAPRAYFGAWGVWLWATWGSARYFAGALAFFPKVVVFARALEAAEVSHLHAHFASHAAAAALVVGRLTGIPFSFTAHGSDLHRESRMLREKVAEAAFVVTVSQYNREWIAAHCGRTGRDKTFVVHCGVDTQFFHPPAAKPDRRGAVILCIGTLHEVKGQKYLLEACAYLRAQGVPFRCDFIGDGPDHAALTRQVHDAQLADCVQFLGKRTQREIAARLRDADLLAVPSVVSRDGRREGVPVVLMEALASGLPVVASRLSGIPEIVEDEVTGLLAPPGDATALAAALERLICDRDLRARLGAAGRGKVAAEFDMHRNARSLAELFQARRAPCLD